MRILGVEGTAHTLGVGIVEWDPTSNAPPRILANARDMLQPEDGGIHPREAARHHQDVAPGLLDQALTAAELTLADLDLIAFSQGPGLGPCLRVAATVARAASLRAQAPLKGVNHCVAHLEVGRVLGGMQDPILCYASGANTQIIAYERGRYRVFGETLDVGLGNALDKFAREQGMPFPGGPKVEQLALKGSGTLLDLPYAVKGMDLCFGGLAVRAGQLHQQGAALEDLCFSIQETAFAALVETTERALAQTGKQEVLLGGGVGCNARLQTMLREMAESRGARFYAPPKPLLVDNGAMLAVLGAIQYQAEGPTPLGQSQIRPYERTDDVEVTWRS